MRGAIEATPEAWRRARAFLKAHGQKHTELSDSCCTEDFFEDNHGISEGQRHHTALT